ncbi:hypothetical protein C8R45DRAFT_931506 [Mycena sanguinolenta]|nr:hypothetical protein C8R45DRAFT_931506 [Mycena sanguinolenta]
MSMITENVGHKPFVRTLTHTFQPRFREFVGTREPTLNPIITGPGSSWQGVRIFCFEIKLENILALVQVGAACLYYNLYWVDWDQIGFLKCRSYFGCRQSTRLIRIELTGIIREAAVSPHHSGGYACMADTTETASKCFTPANVAPITQLHAYYTHLEPGDKVQR